MGDEDTVHVPQLTLRDTALDAISRKRHAVHKGYFADPYLRFFTADTTYINSPLMNRGYWLRVRAVESALNRFVESLPAGAPFQVISLGAGYDTLFFRWLALASGTDKEHAANAPCPADAAATSTEESLYALSYESPAGAAVRDGRLRRFVEIDQHEVVHGKARIIANHPELTTLATISTACPPAAPLTAVGAAESADVYRLVAADLCHVGLLHDALLAHRSPTGPENEPHEVPLAAGRFAAAGLIDPTVATIIIAECVLVYLQSADSTALLRELLSNTLAAAPQVALLSYDAINPTTPFGKQMVHTLKERGVELKGIYDLPTPQHHVDRCKALGLVSAHSWTMKALFASVPAAMQKRLQHIEPLDDYDEWCLVHEHYSMTWALKVAVTPDAKPPRLFNNSLPAATI